MNTILQRLLPALPRPVRTPITARAAEPLPGAERLAALFVLVILGMAIFA